jgi:flagellar biosynthesis chaperone FliJ
MAQFHLALDKILRWRAVELANEEAKLQRLILERSQLEAMLERVANERSSLTGSIAALPGLQGADLRAMAAYGLRLRQHVEKLKDAQTGIERNLAAQQKKYAQVKLRLRLLEQLKARRVERWKYDQARQLETLAADSFLAGWNREQE